MRKERNKQHICLSTPDVYQSRACLGKSILIFFRMETQRTPFLQPSRSSSTSAPTATRPHPSCSRRAPPLAPTGPHRMRPRPSKGQMPSRSPPRSNRSSRCAERERLSFVLSRYFLSDTQQLLDPFAKTGSGQTQGQLDNIQTRCFMQGGDKHLFYAHSADLFADPLGMPR